MQQGMVRKEDEALCCGHIKKCLSNKLLDVYASFTDSRKLWGSFKHKYGEQDKGSHFSLMDKYFDFQMVDKKSILEPVDELENDSLSDLLKHIRIEEEIRIKDEQVHHGSCDHNVQDENIVSRFSRGDPQKSNGVKVDEIKKKSPKEIKEKSVMTGSAPLNKDTPYKATTTSHICFL
ncbi:hypothetical protein Tco_1462692 [Tanacetum coccineum]